MPDARPFPAVDDATLIAYRLFDVADDIDLAHAERLLAGEGTRLKLAGERAGFLDLPDPPLTVSLGRRAIELEQGVRLDAAVSVRLFAHGVASVHHEMALPAGADAAALAAAVRAVGDSPALERAARADAEELIARLSPALDDPHRSAVFETYTVVFVRRLAGGAPAADVAGPDLARVLLGEPPTTPLSDQTVANATRRRFSYTVDDLCVLDWDGAYVLEPSGDRSVADVLEAANAQLLELRWYDGVFERELLEVMRLLGQPRPPILRLFSTRSARVARRVRSLIVESLEVVERAENAVRVVGDLYLARIYRSAFERFRITEWKSGVQSLRDSAAEVASLLRSEANATLGHLLETTVVVLIVLELVLAAVR